MCCFKGLSRSHDRCSTTLWRREATKSSSTRKRAYDTSIVVHKSWQGRVIKQRYTPEATLVGIRPDTKPVAKDLFFISSHLPDLWKGNEFYTALDGMEELINTCCDPAAEVYLGMDAHVVGLHGEQGSAAGGPGGQYGECLPETSSSV